MHHYFSLLLFIYSCGLVLFDNPVHLNKLHMLTVIMWASYLLIFFTSRKHTIKFNNMIVMYTLFALFSLSSVLWSMDLSSSFVRSATILMTLFNIFIVYNILLRFNNVEYIFYGIGFALFLNLLISFGIVDLGWDSMEGYWRFQGTTVKSNILANIVIFQIVGVLFLIYRKKNSLIYNVFIVLLLIMCVYIGFITGSKKFMFVLLMIALFVLYRMTSLKKLVFACLILYLLYQALQNMTPFSIFSVENGVDISYTIEKVINRLDVFLQYLIGQSDLDASSVERTNLFNNALVLFYENPIFGSGVGEMTRIYGAYAHNNYLDILANLGVIGLLLYYSIYVSIGFDYFKDKAKSKIQDLFMFYIVMLLVLDFAVVSYASKYFLLFLLVASMIISKKISAHD
jgi:O-antigen ligase